jgi:adenylate cyclase
MRDRPNFLTIGSAVDVRGLPERVRAMVRRSELESEQLIGWVQLTLVATFAALYLSAPRPSDAGMAGLAPVPIALALYTLFTLARLWLAHRDRLPGWLIGVSIVVDVGLLLALIWSFHSDYAQPPAFSLKVPTFVYIFVLIAIRALRFDPRLVLVTGLVAVLGWLGLLAAVLNAAEPGTVTRSFVAYMNGSRVLIGAEIDKIVAVAMVSLVLAAAVGRGRRVLLTALREETAGREVRRFLARGLADAIADAETEVSAGQALERDAAILMLDIRGFTALAAHVPPAEVVRVLTGLHARLVPIVQRHGGIVDKFLGDGIMVTFGALNPSPTAAADAFRALDDLMHEAARWRAELPAAGIHMPLQVNAGLAAGSVVFAILGVDDRLEYTVIGDAVNLAAKLEKHNKVEATRALATEDAFRLALAQGYEPRSEPVGLQRVAVAGVVHPLALVAPAG